MFPKFKPNVWPGAWNGIIRLVRTACRSALGCWKRLKLPFLREPHFKRFRCTTTKPGSSKQRVKRATGCCYGLACKPHATTCAHGLLSASCPNSRNHALNVVAIIAYTKLSGGSCLHAHTRKHTHMEPHTPHKRTQMPMHMELQHEHFL